MKFFAAAALAALVIAPGYSAAQPTINVLVVQEDADPESLSRNRRIQNSVLSEFNQTLNAPAYQSQLSKYGISGMDVYDETAVTIDFYEQDRQRRTDQELVSLSRQISNPPLDVLVPYTLYARAVEDPYTKIAKLQMSMSYRALSVRDGRYLGGDNIDIDPAGVPFTGCAAGLAGTPADPHCVQEFVAAHGERLARNAGNKLAIQLASMLGPVSPGPAPQVTATAPATTSTTPAVTEQAATGCDNLPVTYQVVLRGFEQRSITAIEENMAFWACAMDTNVTDSDFSEITFSYKTRASQQRLLRNLRLVSELIGVVSEARTEGNNTIVVESLGIRTN